MNAKPTRRISRRVCAVSYLNVINLRCLPFTECGVRPQLGSNQLYTMRPQLALRISQLIVSTCQGQRVSDVYCCKCVTALLSPFCVARFTNRAFQQQQQTDQRFQCCAYESHDIMATTTYVRLNYEIGNVKNNVTLHTRCALIVRSTSHACFFV